MVDFQITPVPSACMRADICGMSSFPEYKYRGHADLADSQSEPSSTLHLQDQPHYRTPRTGPIAR